MRPNMILAAFAGAVVVCVAAAFFYIRVRYSEEGVTNALDPRPRQLVQCARQPRIPWAEMFRVLQANDAKAVNVWNTECVRISGVVKEVAPDGAFILIESPTEAVDALSCLPLHQERAKTDFAPGKPINVWGFGEERHGPRYSLKDCDWEK